MIKVWEFWLFYEKKVDLQLMDKSKLFYFERVKVFGGKY